MERLLAVSNIYHIYYNNKHKDHKGLLIIRLFSVGQKYVNHHV